MKCANSALPRRIKHNTHRSVQIPQNSYIISTGITGVWEHLIITNRKAKITKLNAHVRARPLRTPNKNTPATQNEWLPLSTWKKKSIPHFCPSSRRRHALKMSRTHIHSNTFVFIYEGLQSSWFCWVFQICNHYNNTSRSFLYLFVLLAVPLSSLHSKTQRSKFPGGLLVTQVVLMNDEYRPLKPYGGCLYLSYCVFLTINSAVSDEHSSIFSFIKRPCRRKIYDVYWKFYVGLVLGFGSV